MNLNEPTVENVHFIIDALKDKLRMVNADAMRADSFDESNYEDLLDLYNLVMKRTAFSPSEMQAIVAELGSLRK